MRGRSITFRKKVEDVASALPRLPKEINFLVVCDEKAHKYKAFIVRHDKVLQALLCLTLLQSAVSDLLSYSNLEIDLEALE